MPVLRRVRQDIGKIVEDTFAELHNVMLSAVRPEILDGLISKVRPEVKGVLGRRADMRLSPVRSLRRAALCGLGRAVRASKVTVVVSTTT